MDRKFDFVVIGAGTAGCVLAARLSEGDLRVLLLEAGGEARSVWTRIPAGYAKLLSSARYNWLYRTEPESALGNRVLDVPAGRAIGGTGVINGMIYVRGQAADYDDWAAAGNDGWSYADVLPWFKRSEANTRGADAFHGVDGPMIVTDPTPDALSRAFVEAGAEAGWRRNTDFNGADQEGVGFYQLNLRNGSRESTARAFLHEARERKNLTIVTGAHIDRIIIDRRTAVGVEYVRDGRVERVDAAEIVLAAGAFGSPQVLMRSGIGSAGRLRALGIAVVADLPGVGGNLQNHFRASIVVRCRPGYSLNEAMRSFAGRMRLGAQYLLFRRGALATGTSAGGFLRSSPTLDRPNVQMTCWNYSVAKRDARGLSLHAFPAFTINAVILKPKSRGSISLRNRDPAAPPVIRYRHLAESSDTATLVAALRQVRIIAAQRTLAHLSTNETAPGPACAGDGDLAAYARANGSSVYHPVGTCRMGNDPLAVVDARLRVHGIERLRVADASIMPTIVAGNTNAPTVMIAERASAWILGLS
ncbi:MAG TPA: GMC family oxidoreductase N-terminal domain-containing protein [Casimicrobiaceae bacterium]|nr:GMC family oxidoreductase N-terminal domain-containing protein [Casimicrobiaceae bacterium]